MSGSGTPSSSRPGAPHTSTASRFSTGAVWPIQRQALRPERPYRRPHSPRARHRRGLHVTLADASRAGARRLIEVLLETAEAEGYEFALLFSEIDPVVSTSVSISCRAARRVALLKFAREDGAPAMLVRSGDERDIPAIAEMSAKRAPSRPFRARSQRRLDSLRHCQTPPACGSGSARLTRSRVPRGRRRTPGSGLSRSR